VEDWLASISRSIAVLAQFAGADWAMVVEYHCDKKSQNGNVLEDFFSINF
jgi:hypothetical protein